MEAVEVEEVEATVTRQGSSNSSLAAEKEKLRTPRLKLERDEQRYVINDYRKWGPAIGSQ